ncbi:hypothetical protein RYX36_031264, partial [Vicia faba]
MSVLLLASQQMPFRKEREILRKSYINGVDEQEGNNEVNFVAFHVPVGLYSNCGCSFRSNNILHNS